MKYQYPKNSLIKWLELNMVNLTCHNSNPVEYTLIYKHFSGLKTVSASSIEGCVQKLFFGAELNKKTTFDSICVWSSEDHHTVFTDDEGLKLGTIQDGKFTPRNLADRMTFEQIRDIHTFISIVGRNKVF